MQERAFLWFLLVSVALGLLASVWQSKARTDSLSAKVHELDTHWHGVHLLKAKEAERAKKEVLLYKHTMAVRRTVARTGVHLPPFPDELIPESERKKQ